MAKKKKGKEVNPELVQKLETATPVPEKQETSQEPKKRNRRTRAEVRAEKLSKAKKLLASAGEQSIALDDSGYEIIRDIIYSLHTNDVKKYGVPEDPKAFYDEFSKNIMRIINFYGKGYAKPIYFVIVATLFQGYMILNGRKKKIEPILKEKKNADGEKPDEEKKEVKKTGVSTEDFKGE